MEFRILEERLTGLPPITRGVQSFTPVFGYGSKKDLMAFLASERKTGEAYYPLVWVMVPFTVSGDIFKFGRSKAEISIILATITSRDISNSERVAITFEGTLEPLLENVVKSLRYGGNTGLIDGQPFETQKYFGYDTDGSNFTSDVWDAITLKCSINFKYSC